MNKKQEQAYLQGVRSSYSHILQECIKELGYKNPKAQKTSWILEREAIIAQLRDLCGKFGDNDWDEKLHLGDVIEKHLGNHLYNQ